MSMHLRTVTTFPVLALTIIACHPGGGEDVATAAAARDAALAPREVRLVTAEVREEHPSLRLVGEIRAWSCVFSLARSNSCCQNSSRSTCRSASSFFCSPTSRASGLGPATTVSRTGSLSRM